MGKCSKCAKAVNKKNPGLQCTKCVKWIHAECAMITKDQLAALSSTDSVDWKCRSCVGVTKTKRVSCILPDQEEDESDIEPQPTTSTNAVLRDMSKKLEILTVMKKTLDGLVESVDFYASQYQELMEHKNQTDRKLQNLENRNNYLEKYSKTLEQRIAEMENKSKEKNIEIVGLESREGEVLKEVAKNIAQKLNISSDGICEIKRVGGGEKKPLNSERPRNVIVTFETKEKRDEWIAKRKSRITNEDIYNNGNKNAVFINEDLSRYIKQTLWLAKMELKDKFKYIWPQNGKVLVRKDSDTKKIHEILSEADISNLKNSQRE